MEKDVSFDPCVRAVQIQFIIAPPTKNVVVILDNCFARSISAGEIHDVVITRRTSKETVTDNAAAARLDSACSVDEFKRRRAGRKNTMADQEGAVIQRKILVRTGAKSGVIERQGPARHFN